MQQACVGLHLDGLAEVQERFVEASGLREHDSQVAVRVRRAVAQHEGAFEAFDRLGELAEHPVVVAEDGPQVDVGVPAELDALAQRRARAAEPPELVEHLTQHTVVRSVFRSERDGTTQRADRFVEPLEVLQHLAEVVPGLPLTWRDRDELAQNRLCVAVALGEPQRVGVVVVEAVRGGRRGPEALGRGDEQLDGRLHLAALGQDRAEDLHRTRLREISGEHFATRRLRGRQVASLMSLRRAQQEVIERGTQRLAPS